MNALADLASGELLVLLNDDLILDPGSLDRAIQVLESQPGVGLVGGRLRSSSGLLTHAGLLFDNNHIPYNRCHPDDLGSLVDAQALALQESAPMPAVTGALMVIRRSDFQALRFQTDYRVCGEDIALCLDIWDELLQASLLRQRCHSHPRREDHPRQHLRPRRHSQTFGLCRRFDSASQWPPGCWSALGAHQEATPTPAPGATPAPRIGTRRASSSRVSQNRRDHAPEA